MSLGGGRSPEPPCWPRLNNFGLQLVAITGKHSVVDLDPNCIRIQQLCGSGSVFRIRIHTGENRINWRQKLGLRIRITESAFIFSPGSGSRREILENNQQKNARKLEIIVILF